MTRVVFVDNNDSSVQIEICHNCSYCHSWIENFSFWDLTKIYGSRFFQLETPPLTDRSKAFTVKGSSDQGHFIFEIDFGTSRIRHTTTLILNDELQDRLRIDWRWCHLNSESVNVGCALSDIDFKNEMSWVWTSLKIWLDLNRFYESGLTQNPE